MTGENFFLTMPYCNTNHMNAFLRELSEAYKDDVILLVTDGARWHISKTLIVPSNIELLRIPPYTPEMNPIAIHTFRSTILQQRTSQGSPKW